jgi:hypothetical protein
MDINYSNVFRSKGLHNRYTQIGIFGTEMNHLATLFSFITLPIPSQADINLKK